LNPVTLTPPDRQEVAFRGGSVTATKVFLAVKTLKDAGCDEIRPETLKTLNRGILWRTRVHRLMCGMAFWKDTERLTNWSGHPNTQEGRQEEMH